MSKHHTLLQDLTIDELNIIIANMGIVTPALPKPSPQQTSLEDRLKEIRDARVQERDKTLDAAGL